MQKYSMSKILTVSKDYQFTTVEGASFIKYAINTFLASKVIFFNEFFNLIRKTNPEIEWDDLKKIIQLDERIGNSHMDVPSYAVDLAMVEHVSQKIPKHYLNILRKIILL